MTLTGAGGIGKTRVAARVVDEERDGHRDGRWWVELSSVGDPALVLPTVATAIGLQAPAAVALTELIADQICDRRALLVLDGCERQWGPVVDLVIFLRTHCPNLRIVATSRQVLGVSGEAVVRVPPLTVPPAGVSVAPESLAQYEAIALFLDRAALAGSGLRLTDDNAEPVAELCRTLEGIPLAVELAAARSVALSPEVMLEQMCNRLRLLDDGYVDAPERHRSLAACAAWSFDLCTDGERALWSRMAVFSGGCDFHAVEAVCVGDDLDAELQTDEIPGLLASLVDQAVLNARHSRDGSVRYTMPAYLAAYGRQQLDDRELLDRWRGRHAQWIAGLAVGFRAGWTGGRQGSLLRDVRREHANVRAALDFCASDLALSELVLGIVTDLDLFWVTTGLANEARHWLGVGLASQRGKPAERALGMLLAAKFAGLQYDLTDARALLARGSSAAETADDDHARGLLHVLSAVLAVWDGEFDAAVEAAQAAVPLLRSSDDAELLGLAVVGLAMAVAGDREAAVAAYERAIARSEEIGETFRRSLALSGLGELALEGRELARATELTSQALRMKVALDDRMGIAVGLDSLGRIALAESRFERAAVLLGAAQAIWDAIGMRETGNPFVRMPTSWESLHRCRRRLGKTAFRTAFRQGASLTQKRAIDFALTDELDLAESDRASLEESPLTRRETEVAALVAEGLSNPEIAARLVISVRTAQGHVENILRKLGFRSRSMIAAWVTERARTS